MNRHKNYTLLADGKPSLQFTSLEEAKTYVLNQQTRCDFQAEYRNAPAPSQLWRFDFELENWVLQN